MKRYTYRWEYHGKCDGYGCVCNEGRTKWPRPTGMIWKGGLLRYRWSIGHRTEFWSLAVELGSDA